MRRFPGVVPVLCLAAVAAFPSARLAAQPILVGDELDYTVRRGDTLAGIGARFAVAAETLAARNGLSRTRRLVAGKRLHVDNRHIVPKTLPNGILINLPQRLLFYFVGGRLESWYPVALGQPGSWQTPTGSYRVLAKEKDPVWEVPSSIQQEMRRNGEKVRTRVPPGSDNPLGRFRLRLSLECCGIHGTNAPQSIYRAAGCRGPLFPRPGGRCRRDHLRTGARLPGQTREDSRRAPSRHLSPHGRQPGNCDGDRREPRPRVGFDVRPLGRDHPGRRGDRGPPSPSDRSLERGRRGRRA
ncbi:MAG: hypothetical protein DMF55_13380 [Acidobacteria bacterium]|nr:MAG: hypothetical protein DMF55_13380 [Acidobacteriota bacterium]